MRMALAAWLIVAGGYLSAAADDSFVEPRELEFAKETYIGRFVAVNEHEKLAEFTRAGDPLEDWQKLVAVRHYPLANGTPAQAAAAVVRALQATNPLAKFQLLVKEDGSEALVDFITWPKDGTYAEFNAFRYIKKPNQAGLVSYQFAYRFTDTSPTGTEQFKRARQLWLEKLRNVEWQVSFEKE